MAINLELAQDKKSEGRGVAEAITNITAAGRTTLTKGTRQARVRNRTGGDAVYVKAQPLSGAANAAVGNSYLLPAGEELTFKVPSHAETFCVDVRATA